MFGGGGGLDIYRSLTGGRVGSVPQVHTPDAVSPVQLHRPVGIRLRKNKRNVKEIEEPENDPGL